MIPTLCWQQAIIAANDEGIPLTIVQHVYGLPPSWLRRQAGHINLEKPR